MSSGTRAGVLGITTAAAESATESDQYVLGPVEDPEALTRSEVLMLWWPLIGPYPEDGLDGSMVTVLGLREDLRLAWAARVRLTALRAVAETMD